MRRFSEVAEYRATVASDGGMRALSLEIELTSRSWGAPSIANQIVSQLQEALGLTVPVRVVDPGTLPRFEMKARRFVVQE